MITGYTTGPTQLHPGLHARREQRGGRLPAAPRGFRHRLPARGHERRHHPDRGQLRPHRGPDHPGHGHDNTSSWGGIWSIPTGRATSASPTTSSRASSRRATGGLRHRARRSAADVSRVWNNIVYNFTVGGRRTASASRRQRDRLRLQQHRLQLPARDQEVLHRRRGGVENNVSINDAFNPAPSSTTSS